jgi:hypothetical protein
MLAGSFFNTAEKRDMYEHYSQRPLPRRHFLRRMLTHSIASLALIVCSLFLGIIGYEHFEGLPWRDAFLNAAMLLGGMGPVDPPRTDGGKVFAGLFALYAGLVFLLAAGVIVTPTLHRMLHLLHWEEKKNS